VVAQLHGLSLFEVRLPRVGRVPDLLQREARQAGALSGFRPSLDFRHAPIVSRFFLCRDITPVIWGPVGSGKSTGCCAKLMSIALEQQVDKRDGYRRARFAIVRNTGPELKSTTIKTWLRIFPEANCGPIVYSAPITQTIDVKPRGKPGDPNFVPGLSIEVIFLALDDDADVKKLRSLDLTAAWVNEGSEVPLAIVNMLRRRVNRYPLDKPHVEPVGACVMIDSNATDEDNPLREKEIEAPDGWTFFHQPPAVLEVTLAGSCAVCIEDDPRYAGRQFQHGEVVRAAGKAWVVNPDAENLANLAAGYYGVQQLPGSTLEQIQRDLQVKFVYVQEGKPVVPEFVVQTHVGDPEADLAVPLEFGGDIGKTINPSFVIGQRPRPGVYVILDEVVCEDVNIPEWVGALTHRVTTAEHLRGTTVGKMTGDPDANKRDDFGTVIFQHVRNAGIPAQPAPTNDVELRVKVTRSPFSRMAAGKPAIIIHRRCKKLIAALAGKWKMRRLQISGEARYADKPDKSHPWSDLGDALGYFILGGNVEVNLLRGRNTASTPSAERAEHRRVATFDSGRSVQAKVDFDIFRS
jgi:hypothetical protein